MGSCCGVLYLSAETVINSALSQLRDMDDEKLTARSIDYLQQILPELQSQFDKLQIVEMVSGAIYLTNIAYLEICVKSVSECYYRMKFYP